MNPMEWHEIRGNWATLLLPISEDDRIDFVRLREELQHLCSVKPNGIYSGGTAGEFYAQSEDEFDQINQMLAEQCERAGIPFQIGASHMSPRISLNRVYRAARLRPGAIQVILPDWIPVNDAEATAFLLQAAQAANGIGLVLYNPPHAKRVLNPATIKEFKQNVPALVGVKVRGGNEAWYDAMRIHTKELSIFVAGHDLATGIARGAHGAYSNIACLSPHGAQQWYNMMMADLPKAMELQHRIQQFLTTHLARYRGTCSGAACDKFLASVGNWAEIGTRMRWPYSWIAENEAIRLRPAVREALPELF